MRLIDADALIEEIVKIPGNRWNTKTFGEVLDRVPTVAMGTDHITIQWTPEIDKLARDVAFRGLNEFSFMGKSIREWIEIILEQNARTAWVSAKKRLPDRQTPVLVYVPPYSDEYEEYIGHVAMAYYTHSARDGYWAGTDGNVYGAIGIIHEPTYWMPLPEPPKEEE